MEFKDSGFIKDFQLTIKVNENTKVIKQPLIDCMFHSALAKK